MSCCGTSRKAAEIRPEQKWDAISLRDFRSNSCFKPMAYGYLFFSLGLSLAVYGVDIFTAINLLAFDTWSSSIEPTQKISFDTAKLIFSICIIASFVNLAFEHIRAMRVMKRGSVAECYLDNLAVRMESIRPAKGQGWRRFLVFAELTKSKKGAEYIALFTYFSFQSWIRVIVCSGPRQAVNALTLYAVYTSDLIPTDNSSVGSTLGSFFSKLQSLAQENMQQAVILSGMLFTLVIWVFSFLFLLAATFAYVFFLWHYIPRQDGGLHGYCERKINKRLMSIVSEKVKKALAKEERQRLKEEFKAAKKAGDKAPTQRQATLPTLPDVEKADSLPDMPTISRTETMATLPVYTSRPGTPNGMDPRPLPSRQGTNQSNFSARAPLIAGAAGMGFDRSASPVPSLPDVNFSNYQQPPRTASPAPSLPTVEMNNFQPPLRPGTAASSRGFGSGPQPVRAPSNGSALRSPLGQANATQYSADALPAMPERILSPGPVNTFDGRSGLPGRQPFADGRASPAPSMYSNRGPAFNGGPDHGPGYIPMRSATNPIVSPQTRQFPPQRNMTAPMPPRGDYIPRPGTAASQRSMGPGVGYGIPRPGTAASQGNMGPSVGYGIPRPGTAASQGNMGPGPGYGYNSDMGAPSGYPRY
ncbi:hypothetical protein GGR56DRAFT_419560 [Xylariaceae sp. FL0804]|nr:hypothetical protein GGR56DRAFT_419560 [Xylariaceae sp. FL0804]